MTSTLARYIARLLLARLAAVLGGLVGLFVLLDFLADGDQALAASPGAVAPALRYILLRLPDALSALIPFSALLAGLLTFAELARRRELAVILSCGVSRIQLALATLPVAIVVALGQFVVEDQAVPPAARELREWGIGDYAPQQRDAFAWLRVGEDVVRYRAVAGDEPRLEQITIYRRDPSGALIEAMRAEQAAYEANGWVLYGVRHSTGESGALERGDRLAWPGGPDPSFVAQANSPPEIRSAADLAAIVAQAGLGDYPLYVYRLAFHERLVRPVMTVLLVLLSVAVARPQPQGASIGASAVTGALLGALGWTAATFLASMGELGLQPPLVAAWAPVAIMALIIGFLGLQEPSTTGLARR